MSGLVEHLLAERTPLELAKELAQQAKENAALRERVARQDVELFLLKAKDYGLKTAVAAFIKAKGRHHTEQSYKALVAAFDSAQKGKDSI